MNRFRKQGFIRGSEVHQSLRKVLQSRLESLVLPCILRTCWNSASRDGRCAGPYGLWDIEQTSGSVPC
jgi:hypothetical protein